MNKCNFTITINNKTFDIKNTGTDNSYDSFRKSLLEFVKDSNNNTQSKELYKLLLSGANIQQSVNINENMNQTVGLYSPTDLIYSFNREIATLLKKLPIKKGVKNNVVVGYGDTNTRTGYYNNQLFVNLNYDYDYSNKIKALFELAIHDSFPNDYNDLSNKMMSLDRGEVIEKVLKDITGSDKGKLKSLISKAYSSVDSFNTFHSDEISGDIEQLSTFTTFKQFNGLSEDENYTPKEIGDVQSLEQGDLVGIKIGSTNNYSYEIYYDSQEIAVNNGDSGKQNISILKTLVPDSSKKEGYSIRWRQINGYKIPVKRFNPAETPTIQISSNFGSTEIKKVLNANHVLSSASLKKLIDSGLVKNVTLKGKIAKTIKSTKGLNINTTDNLTLPLSDISKFEFNLFTDLSSDEVTLENLNSNWTRSKVVSIGDKVIIKSYKKEIYKEAIILGISTNDKHNYIYLTKDGDKYVTGSTLFPHRVLTDGGINAISIDESINIENAINEYSKVKNDKNLHFTNLIYSVTEATENTPVFENDFIVPDLQAGVYFKVLGTSGNYIRTSLTGVVGETKFIEFDRSRLNNSYVFSNNRINKTFAQQNIWKNRPLVSDGRKLAGLETKPAEVYINPKTGFLKIVPKGSKIDSDLKLYTNEYIEFLKTVYKTENGFNITSDNLSMYYSGNNIVKNNGVTTMFKIEHFSDIDEVAKLIVPGTFVRMTGDSNSYIVEKKNANNLVISQYGFSQNENKNVSDKNLSYVKKQTKLLNNSLDSVVEIFVPNWATENIQKLNLLGNPKDNVLKESKQIGISETDSPQLIMAMVNLLEEKFGVKINIIGNDDLNQFSELDGIDKKRVRAFVSKGEIYVNIDLANIEEPLHELLHMVLGTMKAINPDNYYNIIGSIQGHPLYNTIKQEYQEINSDVLEEVFIRLLTKTFRNNISREGVFNEVSFNSSIRAAINEMLNLTGDINNIDSISLLKTPISELLLDFGSSLIENRDTLIDEDNLYSMMEVSSVLKKLLKNNQLTQIC